MVLGMSSNGEWPAGALYSFGDRVRKKRGSQWQGRVCGFYSTENTPIGYAIESEREIGSVQVWPEVALELVDLFYVTIPPRTSDEALVEFAEVVRGLSHADQPRNSFIADGILTVGFASQEAASAFKLRFG